MRHWLVLILASVTGCAGIPDGIKAVRDFDVDRYLGTWYEIARLDHSFERGLSNVTATYTLRPDGRLTVLNRGFDDAEGEWRSATGRAALIGEDGEARLKVAFFLFFYGGYNVFALDHENYGWALVCGNDRSYLWILARTPTLDKPLLAEILQTARQNGFETDKLIWVKHDKADGRP